MIWKDGDFVQVELWKNFSKRKNSTKIPASAGQTLEVVLKDTTSIENPTFILSGNEFEYNYIKALGHYYFVKDLRSVRHNVIEIDCEQDVLATYKSEILATSAYVLRSSSEFDGEVVDNLYPITGDVEYNETRILNILPNSLADGTYVIGIVGTGTDSLKQGSVTYYGMTKLMLQTMCGYLFSEDIWQRLRNDYENPLDYIVSCYWLPFDLTSDTETIIKFGRFNLEGCTGFVLDSTVKSKTTIIDIVKHPLASTKGEYLNLEPFTQYYITATAIGNIQVPAIKLKRALKLLVTYTIDIITGQARLVLSSDEIVILKIVVQAGVPVALSQNAISTGSVVGTGFSILSAAASAFEGFIPGVISGTMGAINSSYGAVKPEQQNSGSNGSFLTVVNDLYLVAQFNGIADEDNEHHGRPLCKMKTLGSLSGYTLCSDASVNLSGFSGDKDEVNAYLNSGFYIE